MAQETDTRPTTEQRLEASRVDLQVHLDSAYAGYDRLSAQRDRLLAVCKAAAELADDAESLPYPYKVRWRLVCEAARAAIASATTA